MTPVELPQECGACGEHFPDEAAVFSHPCEGIERIRRSYRPVLTSHRRIIQYDRKLTGWRRRLVDLGVRWTGSEDLLGALLRMRSSTTYRLERKLTERGLIEPERTEEERIRTRYQREEK